MPPKNNNKAALEGLGLGEKTWGEDYWIDHIQRLYVKAQRDIAKIFSPNAWAVPTGGAPMSAGLLMSGSPFSARKTFNLAAARWMMPRKSMMCCSSVACATWCSRECTWNMSRH